MLFAGPAGVAVDPSGSIYVADSGNGAIRKITPSGVVLTVAGGGPQLQGYQDGAGTRARFNRPVKVALDSSGGLLVADQGNNRIRRIAPSGTVTTIAGNLWESGVAAARDGSVYAAGASGVIKIAPNGVVSRLAGSERTGYRDSSGLPYDFSSVPVLAIIAPLPVPVLALIAASVAILIVFATAVMRHRVSLETFSFPQAFLTVITLFVFACCLSFGSAFAMCGPVRAVGSGLGNIILFLIFGFPVVALVAAATFVTGGFTRPFEKSRRGAALAVAGAIVVLLLVAPSALPHPTDPCTMDL